MLTPTLHAPLIARLRTDLAGAGFTVEALTTLWGAEAAEALARGFRVPARRAIRGATRPSAVLAAVFVLGDERPVEELDAALPGCGAAGAEELGLVALDGDRVRTRVDLRPYSFVDGDGVGNWWIASDPGELTSGGPLREDHVLGVGGASLTLSGLILPIPVGTALDLGTGCGIQALHAARYADHVVATDISERALAFAAFNAALNAVDTIEFRLGSLFEPVAGERFDLIVSNPPFVITPRAPGVPEYEYRDGGRAGDELIQAVIGGLRDHLAPGGTAQLLGNWEYRAGVDAFDRVRAWTDGLDAWVIERDTLDPALYAETWIRDGGLKPGSDDFDRLYELWLDDFRSRAVDRIGFGYLMLRRPAGTPTLARFERLSGELGEHGAGLGGAIAGMLRTHDRLQALDDVALLSQALTVAPDVTEERHHWPGEEHPRVIALRQGGGFARSVPADTALAGFVGACDGTLSGAALMSALAEVLGADAAELRTALLPDVRRLLVEGFLRFAD
ncbi:methyltransferase [Lysobacter korlensis]|uniref:Methyltransferase n=1 Tax=Lysobacter korlensis TaxID=553636 RepID=A0ABV6RNT6_9GAMM